MNIPIVVLSIVFLLIAIRQVIKIKLQIWQIMLLGALVVVITNQISLKEAMYSIDIDIMLFLFSMFIIGVALEESGYLSHISYKIFKKAKNKDQLILLILFVMGFGSAILMNDTIAIIGTPVMLLLAKKHNISKKPLLLALAFSITIGSVISPIGNPQNFIIANQGNIKDPFITFLKYLLIPTIINLLVIFVFIKIFYKEEFKNNYYIDHSQEPIKDRELAKISKISIIILLTLIVTKIILINININFNLVYITIIAAIPIIILSRRRFELIKKIDWSTLIFFSSMFILMKSVWNTGFFQNILNSMNIDIISIPIILMVSIILSQLISNVPLVVLYLPIIMHAGAATKELIALAVGSTIAGNLLILGAASNIIIIQNAEKRTDETITFLDFAKIGIPITIINLLIYWLFIGILF